MNLLLLSLKDFAGPKEALIQDDRVHHLNTVLRVQTGQTLKVGRVGGKIGTGVVLKATPREVRIRVEIPEGEAEVPAVSLIIAVPRPQTIKKVLEIAGCFGLKSLYLVDSERVQKSYFSSKMLQENQWRKHLTLGMEQGCQTFMPSLHVAHSLKKFFKEFESSLKTNVKLLLDTETEDTLWQSPLAKSKNEEIVCAIGPEGGWIHGEREQFKVEGFQSISLGSAILRVENAVCALLAQIELLQSKLS